jgi:4-amino-4-deoxy-L-arabinose transferase-like glycosyltransferase
MHNWFSKANRQKECMYVALLSLLLFTFGLWTQPFVGFDSRFALFAQEMWRHGPSLFPTTYGAPYPDYPSTSTLLIWICSLPFGGVTRLSAVLPTAVAAALNLAITYRLLARCSRYWALATVGFELLTGNFLASARSISLDQMVATVTLCTFYRAYTGARQSRSTVIALALLLVIGFAIRGPVGVVIPAGVVGVYYLLSAQWKQLLRFGSMAVVVLLGGWFSWLALTSHFYGADFAREVSQMMAFGRLELGSKPAHGFYFYSSFVDFAAAYPVAVIVILLLLPSLRKRLRKPLGDDCESLLIYLIAWMLVLMIGLSIPDTKKLRYLLPAVPPMAALAAYLFVERINRDYQNLWDSCRNVLEAIFLYLPSFAAIGSLGFFLFARSHASSVQLPLVLIMVCLLAIQLAMLRLRIHATPSGRLMAALSGAALTAWVCNLLVIEPATLAIHDTRTFVLEVETLQRERPGQIVFFRVGKDAGAIKFLVNLDYDLRPHFSNDSAELDVLNVRPAYIILQDDQLSLAERSESLQNKTPVLRDHFDHHNYSVFYIPAN